MLKLRRPEWSAKWAGRMLVVGALAVGPVVIASSTASALQSCGNITLGSVTSTCAITGTATVGAGSLAVGAPSTVKWAGTLNGYDLSQDAAVTYNLVDATGSGSGWTLSASATALTDSTGTTKCSAAAPCRMHKPFVFNASAKTAQSNTPPKPTCATSSTCTLPTYSKVAYPVSITPTAQAPTTVVTAAKTSGMGAITCPTDLWLSIPANAHAGMYTNTITLTISSGP